VQHTMPSPWTTRMAGTANVSPQVYPLLPDEDTASTMRVSGTGKLEEAPAVPFQPAAVDHCHFDDAGDGEYAVFVVEYVVVVVVLVSAVVVSVILVSVVVVEYVVVVVADADAVERVNAVFS
jgi:hypothetical protein